MCISQYLRLKLNTEGQCSVTPGRLGRRVSAKGFPKIKSEEGMTFREARSLSSFLSFLSTCKQCGIRHEELQTKILAITATSADSDQTLDQSMKSFESEFAQVPYFENVLCQCMLFRSADESRQLVVIQSNAIVSNLAPSRGGHLARS